jgi:hypothetical protein
MKYLIVSAITLNPGLVLGLSDEQAAARKHAVQPLGKGKYEVISPVQFKAGETIHTDAELPKALANAVEQAARKNGKAAPEAPVAPSASDSSQDQPQDAPQAPAQG